jgi:TonB family protein
MYFDFEDHRPDISPVGRAISWREGVLLSIIVHLVAVIIVVAAPEWIPFGLDTTALEAVAVEEVPADEPERFVFIAPAEDIIAPSPPDRAELSDVDRVARAPERAPEPENPLPFSLGDTSERVEPTEPELSEGDGPEPNPLEPEAPSELADLEGPPEPPSQSELRIPESQSAMRLPPQLEPRAGSTRPPAGGSLGDALRNLQQYVERERFNNPQGGGGQFGPTIQFDTKGVEFGPWIRRFIAQVQGNWEPLIPQAAMFMSGRVVLTFNVHKSGAVTDLAVASPSTVEAFTNAAFGAMVSSNPTAPLPVEYPADKAFFTVTFFYNEPPQ